MSPREPGVRVLEQRGAGRQSVGELFIEEEGSSVGGCASKELRAHGEAAPASPARQSPVSPPPREGHGPSGRSVSPRRGCLSQRPPLSPEWRTRRRRRRSEGSLASGGEWGAGQGGLPSSRDTWDVLGGLSAGSSGQGGSGGKATWDGEEEEVTSGRAPGAVPIAIPAQAGDTRGESKPSEARRRSLVPPVPPAALSLSPGGQRAGGSGEDAPDAGCQDDGEDDAAQHDHDLLLLGETGTVSRDSDRDRECAGDKDREGGRAGVSCVAQGHPGTGDQTLTYPKTRWEGGTVWTGPGGGRGCPQRPLVS